MAKLKSFEQFVSEMDRADEIEKDIAEVGTPEEKDVEEVKADAEEVQEEESEEVEAEDTEESEDEEESDEEESEDEEESDDEDEDESDDEDEESEEEAIEESEEVEEDRAEEIAKDMAEKGEPKSLAEMLTELYESSCKNEAKAYEEDAHDEHTIESYMKENAALVAGLMAKSLKEMKEDYAVEAYEAACNEMVESYTKKMNEMKEMDSAVGSEEEASEE